MARDKEVNAFIPLDIGIEVSGDYDPGFRGSRIDPPYDAYIEHYEADTLVLMMGSGRNEKRIDLLEGIKRTPEIDALLQRIADLHHDAIEQALMDDAQEYA